MHRRKVLVLGGGLATMGLAGCSEEEAPREPAPDGWFEGVRNYDGFEDFTDQDQIAILVGAGEEGFQFDPNAISVTPGTTVRFEWTGNGGEHNVKDPEEDWINPEGLLEEEGHIWERSFDEPGTHRYECEPHSGLGMKGAVFVDAYTDE